MAKINKSFHKQKLLLRIHRQASKPDAESEEEEEPRAKQSATDAESEEEEESRAKQSEKRC